MAKNKKRHEDLNQIVKDLVLNAGAIDQGGRHDRKSGGRATSTDLSCVLSGAKSAVVFALPLDPEKWSSF